MIPDSVTIDLDPAEPSLRPPRSKLLPVHPQGIHTWRTESLPSYIDRLTRVHRIPLVHLKKMVLNSLPDSTTGRNSNLLLAQIWGDGTGGIGSNTKIWTDGLGVLLLDRTVLGTTLLTLSGRVSNRKLISPIRRQCPKCAELVEASQSNYHYLLWAIEAVSVCPEHGCPLVTAQNMLEYQRAHWRTVEQPRSKESHGKFSDGQECKDDLARELERSRLVAKFLESSFMRYGAVLEPDRTVAGFLKEARRILYQGIGSHLANQLLVGKGALHDWIAGLHLPSFGQVVDIAQALNCSIEAVLTGDASQLPLFPPDYTKRSSRQPRVVRNIKGKDFKAELLRTIRCLRSELGCFAPISWSLIARRMGVDRQAIAEAYPGIASTVTADYLMKKSRIAKLTRSVRHHAYREAAILIAQDGQLPTRNKVMGLLEEVSVFTLHDRLVCQSICMAVRTEFRISGRR